MAVTDFETPTMKPEDPIMPPIAFKNASRLHRSRLQRPTRQRGSLLIQFAVFLSITVLILGIVDLGYSFYAKRDLQRIADLAAIEAVQGIDLNDPSACTTAGTLSVTKNWPSPINRTTTDPVVCGEWNPQTHKDSAGRHFVPNIAPQNAAQVVLTGESPRFIPAPWSRSIRAEAIAQRTEPATAFQIGSQLLNLDKNAPLGKLLTLIGLDVDDLRVLDHAGLVNAKISPSGLLKALNVDLGIEGLSVLTADQLADLNKLTLLQILEASLKVASDDTLKADLRAVIDVLKDLTIDSLPLLNMTIPLLGDSSAGTPGIFTFLSLGKETSPNGAALDAQVGVGAIINTAIMIAANGHALEIPYANILNAVKLNLTVVEPPTIVMGPVGNMGNSSQIRLNLDIDSKELPAVGGLLDILGVRINLPIKIEGVSADGKLVKTHQCTKKHPLGAIDVEVESRVAKITIGNPGEILIKTPLSVNIRGPITVTALPAPKKTYTLVKGESLQTDNNPLFLGDTVASVADALTNVVFQLLGGLFSPPSLGSDWKGMGLDEGAQDAQIKRIAEQYLTATENKSGRYNVDAAIDLMLHGRGTAGSNGYISPLIKNDFVFNNAIPASCFLFTCQSDQWKAGSFSEAFKSYANPPFSLLDILGISTLTNGYSSCSGLLTTLLVWNSCVASNLEKLLKRNITELSFNDGNAFSDFLKNNTTCNGILCMLLKPLLEPVKLLLNGVGQAILSPLLTHVVGGNLGSSELKALDINCNSAELVY